MPTTKTLVRLCGWRILVSRGYKISSCRQRRLWLDCADGAFWLVEGTKFLHADNEDSG